MKKSNIDRLCKLAAKIAISPTEKIPALWKQYFYLAMCEIGFDRKSTRLMFNWGSGGHNWSLLHDYAWMHTTEYKQAIRKGNQFNEEETKLHWLHSFISDVKYISDRISIDRVLRCHWLYNRCIGDALYYNRNKVR